MKPLHSPEQIVAAGLCIGCGSCAGQSPASFQMRFDRYGNLKPEPVKNINFDQGRFARTCPFSGAAMNEDQLADRLFPDARYSSSGTGRYDEAWVGHASEGTFRQHGSSGGMVSWVATELLRRGAITGVVHVVPVADPHKEGRFFRYAISRTADQVLAGAKSRYYPVELSSVLTAIRNTPGTYAVVGIPCFIKAIQLLRMEDPLIRERIRFTLGLFCGHMKSARFVESFAWQMNASVTEVRQVEFRYKDADRPANWYNARLTLATGQVISKDWWHLSDGDWGAGFFMNSACNYCDDVMGEAADISFGDAWVEPYSADGRGTNVVVSRSPVLTDMINRACLDGRVVLKNVDAAFVENTQAAGLRQRREGLAFRLSRISEKSRNELFIKRINEFNSCIDRKRRLIYRMRMHISTWSHRVFHISRVTGLRALYIYWSRMMTAIYHALAYHRGWLGRIMGDR